MTLGEFSIRTPSEYVEPLSELFRRYGEQGVAIEEDGGYNPDEGESPAPDAWVTLRTYLPDDDKLPRRRAAIDAGVRLVALVASVGKLCERVIEETEWRDAYKRHLKSLRIGDSLMVVPSWDEPADVGSRQVIRLDPGLAFGTGHHPTTRMCLKLVEELVRPGASVLDVGCGSGILSIAAAKLGAGSALGFDVEADAVIAAGRNIVANEVEAVAKVVEGTFQTGAGAGQYDLVFANISAKVILGNAEHFARAAKPGGVIVISGILQERGDEVTAALVDVGLGVNEVRQEGDWLAILAAHS
jgi:ribosomal protein L11 methyltransferase